MHFNIFDTAWTLRCGWRKIEVRAGHPDTRSPVTAARVRIQGPLKPLYMAARWVGGWVERPNRAGYQNRLAGRPSGGRASATLQQGRTAEKNLSGGRLEVRVSYDVVSGGGAL